jgi:hypothetical protein
VVDPKHQVLQINHADAMAVIPSRLMTSDLRRHRPGHLAWMLRAVRRRPVVSSHDKP